MNRIILIPDSLPLLCRGISGSSNTVSSHILNITMLFVKPFCLNCFSADRIGDELKTAWDDRQLP